MPRAKGHDGEEVRQLERRENTSFGLRRTVNDLQLVKLRITQALRRKPELSELLDPALGEIEEVIERLRTFTTED